MTRWITDKEYQDRPKQLKRYAKAANFKLIELPEEYQLSSLDMAIQKLIIEIADNNDRLKKIKRQIGKHKREKE